MRVTTILAIVAIIAALGSVTSSIPVQHVSAQAGGPSTSFPGSIPSGGHATSPCGFRSPADHHPAFCHQ